MSLLDASLANVKTAISRSKHKNKALYEETIGQVSSYLVFLKSTALSQEAANKLSKCLRERLMPIYGAFLQQGIELAVALSKALYETKILTEFTAGNQEQKSLWDHVLNALLSGILDFYDEKPDNKRKDAIGTVLYPTLCSTFFSISISHMSVDLRCTGYMLLSETADSHKANQKRLQDATILGGSRLGSILWRTREFLVLESILTLFARMIPPTGGTAIGKASRTAFIRSVFVESSPDCSETGEKLCKLLENVKSADWDHTATQILDILASSNIAFPQPFEVTEVSACNKAKTIDRLYVDEKGFVGNILLDEDTCDSLSFSYDTVTAIRMSPAKGQESTTITLHLAVPPIIGKDPVTPPCTSEQPNIAPTVAFGLRNDNLGRFRQAMRSRGLGHLVAVDKGAKSSILASPAKLEINSAGELIEDVELAQRIENLSQLYGTNEPSDGSSKHAEPTPEVARNTPVPSPMRGTSKGAHGALHSADPPAIGPSPSRTGDFAEKDSAPSAGKGLSTSEDSTRCLAAASACPESVLGASKPNTPVTPPLRRTKSQMICEAAFGTSDDELSDIEDLAGPPPPPVRTQKDGKKATTIVHFASSSCRALESDDETPSTPTRFPARKATKRLVIVSDDEDEIEEVLPASKISSSVISRRPSTLTFAPVRAYSASSTRKLPTDTVTAVTPAKDCEEAPDTKHDREVVLATQSITEGAGSKADSASSPLQVPEASAKPKNLAIASASTQPRETGLPTSDEEVETPMSSSPVRLQAGRRAVRTALRKKDGTVNDLPQPLSHVQQRRKRSIDDRGDPDEEAQSSPKKRSKEMTVETEAEVSRIVRAAPAVKRYGGRKGRISSPASPDHPIVNYDRIPKIPPVAISDLQIQSAMLPAQDKTAASRATKALAPPEKKPRKSKAPPKAKLGVDRAVQISEEMPSFDGRLTRSKRAAAAKMVIEVSSPQTELEKGASAPDIKVVPVSVDTLGEPDNFAAGLETEGGPRMSTPKDQPRRKSNRMPWKDLPRLTPTVATAQAPHDVVSSAKEERVTRKSYFDAVPVATGAIGVVDDTLPVSADHGDQTMVDGAPDGPVTGKDQEESDLDGISGITERHIVDLTVDSPIKQPPAPFIVEEENKLTRAFVEHVAIVGKVAPSKLSRTKTSVTFAPPLRKIEEPTKRPITSSGGGLAGSESDYKTSTVTCEANDSYFKRGIAAIPSATKARTNSPSMENIANVLDEIQAVILRKIHSNVEGVREDVRLGRERLMTEAIEDLVRMREESIIRYNLLIELEAEYATFGRNVAYGLEDLVQVNRKIESEMKKIIQQHDRGGISKMAPTSLFSAALPSSILAFIP